MAALVKRGLEQLGHSVDVVDNGPDAVWMDLKWRAVFDRLVGECRS
jgi:CheY-like chemotaxis protein